MIKANTNRFNVSSKNLEVKQIKVEMNLFCVQLLNSISKLVENRQTTVSAIIGVLKQPNSIIHS